MASLYKKPVFITHPKTGEKVQTKSRKWWGGYRDALGREKRVPLAGDKMAAQAMLNETLCRVEREKAGLVDPTDQQRKRPLKEHLADFKRYLQNKGVTATQTQIATSQIQKMVDAKKWKLLDDITATDVLDFLGQLRKEGKSAQTYNHYLKSVKQFARWLVRDHRTPIDVLAHLSKMNVSIDRRHDRRALSPDEFKRPVDAAQGGATVETIPGPDRAMMYVLAAWTGFCKGEIGSLSQRSFDLDADPATATVSACYSKRKRQDTQISHAEVVRLLREWLATKPRVGADGLLFPISGKVPGGTERKTHKMMRRDLEAARKKWIKEAKTETEKGAREKTDFLKYCDDSGLFADFHSHRHVFITSLERANVSPKMAQTLARHSDVRLTLGVYTHVGSTRRLRSNRSTPRRPETAQGMTRQSSRPLGLTGRTARWRPRNRCPPRCPLWCPEVPKMVPSCLHRKRYGLHQFAPKERTRTAKKTSRPSPQLATALGRFAPKGANLHRFALPRCPMGPKYPRQDSNL